MKRLMILMLMLAVIACLSFAGEFSGETKAEVERNLVAEENLYIIDAGAVYEAGFLKIGADVKMDTNEDLDIGIPIALTFGPLVVKAEPGADNVRVDALYVFDGDVIYTDGMFKFEYGFGTGTDEIIDMSAKATVTDLIPGVTLEGRWFDADNVFNDVTGIVEISVLVKY